MDSVKGQLTLRGIVIGCVGCAIITAASVYTALPWPIVFAAIISLFFLKALGHGKASLNEANVTHTVMSAGAMVAGGLAFTIPGIWMLGYADEVGWFEMLLVAVSGVIMGLVCTALLRRHFIEDSELEYPIGEAAAQTLIAGDSGGKTGWKLFGSMGFAGAFTALRDFFGVIPAMLFGNAAVPGVAFGIYLSPMLLAVGFLVGTGAVVVWFVGALLANFGIIVGGSAAGLWDVASAQGIVSSLGMGVMMGAGLGVIFKNILPKAWRMLRDARSSNAFGLTAASTMDAPASGAKDGRLRIGSFRLTAGLAALAVAAVALIVCFGLQLGPVPAVIVVLLAFVATAMSAQSVGQTGIDPMEIFGLIVLLAVAAVSSVPQVQLFFVAGIVAVACGLAGDVMNDFHAGHVLGTSPKAQWIGQAIGAVLGALVAVAVMAILVSAYGPESFGPTASFVSAQASVVATMVSGIPSVPAFAIGLAAGFVLYLLNFPAMMLGLGIYLPFYMSLTAFLGAMAKVAYDAVCKLRRKGLSPEAAAEKEKAQGETGLVVSSGLLGGESIGFGRQLPQSGDEWLVVQGAYGEHVRRSRARARQAPNDTSRFIVPRNSILIEELDEATRVRHVFAREPHDRHAVKGELSLSVLFVGKDAHRCPAAAQRRVLVLLHPIELADNPAAVQPRPEEVDAIRTPSIERPRQSHLKLGKREAMLDHRGARDGFATAFATGISVVHRPHGMCRSFEIAADAPNMGNERACPAPTEA